MIVVNTETVPGFRVARVLGLVQGNTVRAKHLGRDIGAGLKNLVGGERMLERARREALLRAIEQAQARNASLLLNVRFATTRITNMAAEVVCYATAVRTG